MDSILWSIEGAVLQHQDPHTPHLLCSQNTKGLLRPCTMQRNPAQSDSQNTKFLVSVQEVLDVLQLFFFTQFSIHIVCTSLKRMSSNQHLLAVSPLRFDQHSNLFNFDSRSVLVEFGKARGTIMKYFKNTSKDITFRWSVGLKDICWKIK